MAFSNLDKDVGDDEIRAVVTLSHTPVGDLDGMSGNARG